MTVRPEIGRPGPRQRRGRVRTAVLALAVVAAGACSANSTAAPEGPPDATFVRATDDALLFTDPIATVGELLAPAEEGQPWTIVGDVFDPEAGTSVASVWNAPEGQRWTRTDIRRGAEETGESLRSVTRVDDALLAVGSVDEGPEADAAIWRETDGEWKRTQPTAMGGRHEQWAFDVAAGAGGIVVAGGESVWGEVRPRVWFSADGSEWETVDGGPGGAFDATGEESIRGVAAVGKGFVAVGSARIEGEQDALVWYSADGRSWEPVANPNLAGKGRQAMLSVVATADVVVAGGYSTDGSGQGRPVVWRSRDGQTWGPATAPLSLNPDGRNTASDLAVRALSAEGKVLYAAGGADWRPNIWRSRDSGRTWERLPGPVHGNLFEDGVAIDDVGAFGGTTVALGLEPTVLFLPNGGRWGDATGPEFPTGGERPFATSVVDGTRGVIVAGGHYTAHAGTTRERYTGQAWREGHGGRWSPLPPPKKGERVPLDAGQINDLAPLKGGGYVAVGFEDFGVAGQRLIGDDQPDGLVWTSRDGITWTRVGGTTPRIGQDMLEVVVGINPELDPSTAIAWIEEEMPKESAPPAGGEGTRALAGVAPLGDGFISVGLSYADNEVDPVAIVSGDGKSFKGEDPRFGGPGMQQFRDVCVDPEGVAVAAGVSGQEDSYDIGIRLRSRAGKWQAAKQDDGTFAGPASQDAFACAASDEGFIVVGSDDGGGDTDARIWTSRDGLTWQHVEAGALGGSGDQWASAVAPVPGGGWLVGGTDTAAGDGDAALWRVSSDGTVTRRDRYEPALGGVGEQSVSAIVVTEGATVVVGDDRGRIGLWESPVLDR